MANLYNKLLFFTTSPRTPSKIIPEIRLLVENFSGVPWNKYTQTSFMNKLFHSDHFESYTYPKNPAFSARDRITRAPKALGFVNLKPTIELTPAGEELVYGKRPQEVFLRQLLKFQLPSPYHLETKDTKGVFNVHPYLEIIRLIDKLESLTLDEMKIFGLQLTHFSKFALVESKIIEFRNNQDNLNDYSAYARKCWTNEVLEIYQKEIQLETNKDTLSSFIRTKKNTMRDYADACFRYLRYTELFTFSYESSTISLRENKVSDVSHILSCSENMAMFHPSEKQEYQTYLYNSSYPALYTDNKSNLIQSIMDISLLNQNSLEQQSISELKSLYNDIVSNNRETLISREIESIKSYSEYTDIIDTFNAILSKDIYDASLLFEWNVWRAMTMLNQGQIQGNFTVDDRGQPLSSSSEKFSGIECSYEDYVLLIDTSTAIGRKHLLRGCSASAKHYQKAAETYPNKKIYSFFIVLQLSQEVVDYFYKLNKKADSDEPDAFNIVPLDIGQFIHLVDNSYCYSKTPTANDLQRLLENLMHQCEDKQTWMNNINSKVKKWLNNI